MKFYPLILTLLLFLMGTGCQNGSSCESLKEKEMATSRDGTEGSEGRNALKEDQKKILECMALDEIDRKIISSPDVFGSMLISYFEKTGSESYTYGGFIEAIKKHQQTPKYQETKEVVTLSEEMEKHPIDLEHWEQKKPQMARFIEPAVLDSFYVYLQQNQIGAEMTFLEAFRQFRSQPK